MCVVTPPLLQALDAVIRHLQVLLDAYKSLCIETGANEALSGAGLHPLLLGQKITAKAFSVMNHATAKDQHRNAITQQTGSSLLSAEAHLRTRG